MPHESVDPQKIKELRDRTCFSFFECRKALIRSGGDVEKAIQALREAHPLPTWAGLDINTNWHAPRGAS